METRAELLTTEDRLALARDFFIHGQYERLELSLLRLERSRLSTEQRVECARMARQAGWPALSLRVLRGRTSTDAELAEYAAALAILGGREESQKLFSRVNPARYPDVLILRAVGAITTWEFTPAIKLLRDCKRLGLDPLGTRMRLHACMLRSGDPVLGARAARGLSGMLAEKWPEQDRAWRVFLLHLRVEALHYEEGDSKAALHAVSDLIGRFPEHDMSIPRVWRALLTMRLRGDRSGANRAALTAERAAFRKLGHWHLLRLTDFHEACILKDTALYRRVHFGTPFAGCRSLLHFRFPSAPALPATFDWHPGKRGRAGDVLEVPPRGLLATSRPARLLEALSTDFYRPLSEVELQEAVFPGCRYEHDRSSARMRIVLHRLRSWLKRTGHGLTIEGVGQAYAWSEKSSGVIRVGDPERLEERKAIPSPLLSLQKVFSTRRFCAAEAAGAWNVPLRTAQALLAGLVRSKHVAVEGRGPSTKYFLTVELPVT